MISDICNEQFDMNSSLLVLSWFLDYFKYQ